MIEDFERSLVNVTELAGEVRASFRFDADLPVFRGHFPGQPLLPAAFQVELIRWLVEHVQQRSLRIVAVRRSKFMQRIRPGDQITISIQLEKHPRNQSTRSRAELSTNESTVAFIDIVLAERRE